MLYCISRVVEQHEGGDGRVISSVCDDAGSNSGSLCRAPSCFRLGYVGPTGRYCLVVTDNQAVAHRGRDVISQQL